MLLGEKLELRVVNQEQHLAVNPDWTLELNLVQILGQDQSDQSLDLGRLRFLLDQSYNPLVSIWMLP